MKYAVIENNKIENMTVSDEALGPNWMPSPNIEVTDEVWQEALNINANCYEKWKIYS